MCGCGKEEVAPAPVKKAEKKAEKEAEEPANEECNPGKTQTGPGCDMDGIIATVRAITGPAGKVQECYRSHFKKPREGKVAVRFSLTPEGMGEAFQVIRDDLGKPAFASCLTAALGTLSYPPPGDVPCQVVYPFTFYPEAVHEPR